MKTTLPEDPGTARRWLLVDAANKPLGRLAVVIANALRGKDLPTYSPAVDTGAFVVVVNAEKVRLTGRKDEQKRYQRYSGFRGGHRYIAAATMRERNPDRMITLAVRGMLPANYLCRRMMPRLKVYAGTDHPHQAQQPQKLEMA